MPTVIVKREMPPFCPKCNRFRANYRGFAQFLSPPGDSRNSVSQAFRREGIRARTGGLDHDFAWESPLSGRAIFAQWTPIEQVRRRNDCPAHDSLRRSHHGVNVFEVRFHSSCRPAGRRRRQALGQRRQTISRPGSPSPATPNTPRKSPSMSSTSAGSSWTMSSGPSSPSAPAAAAGRMYPIGSNAINDRTIGESAQGLADYVKELNPDATPLRCAIAYDTRHRSRQFAELCAEIMVAAGFQVYFLDGYRSTPELSFTGAAQELRLRHHGHGQPQSAQRQRGEGLLVAPAANCCRRTTRGVIDRVMSVEAIIRSAVCRGAGRRPRRVLPGRSRRRAISARSKRRASPGRAI